MYTPGLFDVIIVGIGMIVALVGITSWKLGHKKKARLAKQQEELK